MLTEEVTRSESADFDFGSVLSIDGHLACSSRDDIEGVACSAMPAYVGIWKKGYEEHHVQKLIFVSAGQRFKERYSL